MNNFLYLVVSRHFPRDSPLPPAGEAANNAGHGARDSPSAHGLYH